MIGFYGDNWCKFDSSELKKQFVNSNEKNISNFLSFEYNAIRNLINSLGKDRYKVYFLGTEFGCYYFIKFLMILMMEIGILIYALRRINEDWTITWL